MCSDNKPVPPSYTTATAPETTEAPMPEEVKNTLNVDNSSNSVPPTVTAEAPLQDVPAQKEEPIEQASVAAGAAAVGFTTGYLVAGPIIGLAGAVGGFYAANSSGKVGDTAKVVGRGAVQGFRKGKELYVKHEVSKKAKEAWHKAVLKTREVDEKYRITEKSKEAALAAARECEKINTTYDLSGKAQRGLTRGLEAIAGNKKEATPVADSSPRPCPETFNDL